MRISIVLLMAGLASLFALAADSDNLPYRFPQIADYGGIVPVADAQEPPRRGIKIVFDVLSDSKPAELNKGLESVARYLNLNAEAGLRPTDAKLTVVLHGAATRSALQDSAYARQTGLNANPNLPLIRTLKANGVEVLVCGQALARHKFAPREVAGDVGVAVSAMTVSANRQQDGYSYLLIP